MNRNILCLLLLFFFNAYSSTAQVLPGDLIITEFMADPAAVTDANGEWIEIYNTANSSIDINGFYLSDGGADTMQIQSLVPVIVAAGAHFIFGQSNDVNVNGGISVNMVMGGFTVNNSNSSIILTDSMFNVIDELSYTATTAGKSRSLDPVSYDAVSNDDEDNWCDAVNTYGLGDYGTPGAFNPVCGTAGISELNVSSDYIYFDNEMKFLNVEVHKDATMILCDLSGKIIFDNHLTAGKQQVQLTGLAGGVYFYRLSGATKSLAGKFVVE